MTRQLPALTSLRGIAAFFILVHHITIYYLPELGRFAGRFSPFLEKSYLWVDFFFILSGFIICHVYHEKFGSSIINFHDFKTYMAARFARIYPLHMIILCCLIILELIYFYLYQAGISPLLSEPPFGVKHSVKTIITNFLLLQSLHQYSSWNEPAWAISAEWIMYWLLPVIILGTSRAGMAAIALLFAFAFSGIFFITYISSGSLDVMSWKALLRCATEVTAGVAAYRVFKRLPASNPLNNTFAANSILTCVLLTLSLPVNPLITVVLFGLLIISSARLEQGILANSTLLLLSGQISYSIYMIHWLILEGINRSLTWITGVGIDRHLCLSYQLGIAVLLAAFTFFVSYFVWFFIENPLRSRLKRIC